MHICFLCNEYPPGNHGGVGSFTQTLGRALVKRGHKVTVIGVYPAERAGEEDDEGVHVVRLPHSRVKGTGFLVNGMRIRHALSRIHTNSPIDVIEGPELSLAPLPRDFFARRIIRMQGGHHFFSITLGQKPRLWRSWLERRSFARADAFCAVSRFVAETTRRFLGLGNLPIEILPNPVDTELFHPRPDITPVPGRIVFVGTLCEKKGIRQLVQAMHEIVRCVPQAHLIAVGRDWRDPRNGSSYLEALRLTIAPEVRERIAFPGPMPREQLPELLATAEVCVYPSHMEALGIVCLEGMAMGKPIVASKTGPGPEVIEDMESGLLCNPFDPRSIAGKVITILCDPNLRQYLGQNARLRAVEQFSVQVLVNRNVAFYRRWLQ